ncbi:MAG TPA: restriction endonuclease subunit S [Acidimicrobiales bacterium]|nr:restriction endonuclease subunit S [Acidimicrobiales bacterium]
MTKSNRLPEAGTLGSACDINPPRAKIGGLGDDTAVLFVPMSAVDDETGTVAELQLRRLGELRNKSYTSFAANDVLFAKITPCMENGKAAVVPPIASGIGYGSTEFHVLRPNPGVNPRFIWHFVRQASFRNMAKEHMTSSVGQARVPAWVLQDAPIVIPSESRQSEIVATLDHASEIHHRAAAHLVTAQRAIARFRQAILVAACSGDLTDDWRRRREPLAADMVKEPPPQEANSHSENLPPTWKRVTIGEIAEVKVGGTPSRHEPSYWKGQIAWVSSGEVANCRIVTTSERITPTGLAHSNAKLHPPRTVLIAMIGEGKTRGQSAILDISAATNQNVAAVLPNPRVARSEYVWRWALAQYEITRAVGRGGNQPALNGQKVRELSIPVPPLEEQDEIVRRVDTLLAQADSIEQRVRLVATRLDKVSRAVLGSALGNGMDRAAATAWAQG